MNNKVDKLFKDKLEGHSLPLSAQAWEKLEAQLSKKNRTIVWFRVAAAAALAGLLLIALLQQKDTAAVQTPMAEQKDTVTPEKTIAETIVREDRQKEKEVSARVKQKQLVANKKSTIQKQPEAPAVVQRKENPVAVITEEKVIETTPAVAVVPAKKSMKLTFSLPTLEPKEEAPAEVMVAAVEEKKTTLQKAAYVAHEIRTGEVLGSLREAKNDLFALEFKKDKTKKQQ